MGGVARRIVVLLGAASAASAAIDMLACARFVEEDDPTSSDSAASDAGTGPEVAPCKTATFCDSFDEGELGAQWSRVVINPIGDLTYSSASRSPPFALSAVVSDNGDAFLQRDFPDGGAVTCSFDMSIDQAPTELDSFADIFSITSAGTTVLDYRLFLSMNGPTEDAGPLMGVREDITQADGRNELPKLETQNTFPLPLPGWTRVTIEFDFRAVSVWYGPTLVLREWPMGGFDGVGLSIALGAGDRRAPSIDAATPIRVAFDDVVCTVR